MKDNQFSKRGQSLVEFALILPLLILIMVMIFDLGRAAFYYTVIYNAARDGARYGIIDNTAGVGCATPDTAGIEAEVRARAVGLDPDDLTILSDCDGSKIVVYVSYEFEPVTPLVSSFLEDGKITIESTSSMYVEG